MSALSRRAVLAGAGGLALMPAIGFAQGSDKITRTDPRLDRLIPPGATIETLASGYRWSEGPCWVPQGEYLLFSDVPANVVHRWSAKDGAKPFLSPSGLQGPIPPSIREAGANGLAIDRQGRLIVADSGTRALVRVDLKTKRRTILADRFEGKRFNSVNDVVVSRSGAIYFTDPTYGLEGGLDSPIRELTFSGVFRRDPDGSVTAIDRTHRFPNGIGLSPDERTLYLSLSDPDRPETLAYTLDAKGFPTGMRLFRDFRAQRAAKLPGSPDGMDVAPDGHLFLSGPGGIYVMTPEGEELGLIATGKPMANACVGDRGRALFITASDRICRVPLTMRGA